MEARVVDVTGESLVIDPALAPGPWVWRVSIIDAAGVHRSATWSIRVRSSGAGPESSATLERFVDVNADGFADLVLGGVEALNRMDVISDAYYRVYLGSPSGPGAAIESVDLPPSPWFIAAGDVTGDGFGDVLLGSQLFYGSESGRLLPGTRVDTHPWARPCGDVDGDGFGDFIDGDWDSEASTGTIRVLPGGPSGLALENAIALTHPAGAAWTNPRWGSGGDLDGDGIDDLIVVEQGLVCHFVPGRRDRAFQVTSQVPIGQNVLPSRIIRAATSMATVAPMR